MQAPTVTDVVLPVVVEQQALGGGLEGAERNQRETILWMPDLRSADPLINAGKQLADARGRDMVMNDGVMMGAVNTHRDSIVGSVYRLNAQPNWRAMGLSPAVGEKWADEFQQVVESRFTLVAESLNNWLDASRRMSLTGLVRLALAGYCFTGEVLATVEWIKEPTRPCYTGIQLVSPDRLSNPDGLQDTKYLRRGVEIDSRGKPLTYNIRKSHPGDFYADSDQWTWASVPAYKPWGRPQVIHIFEALLPGQSRGIADMVAALKQMRMTKNFHDLVLQRAVVSASYVAAFESEVPPPEVFQFLGAGNTPKNYFDAYAQLVGAPMAAQAAFFEAAKNVAIDGVKIPALPPGVKLNAKPLGDSTIDIQFEQSLLRNIATTLGLSYEELSRDYSRTNYSSARASMAQTWRFMQSRKKMVADRFASTIYGLWLEEDMSDGNIPLPPGKTRDFFYEPLMREAFTNCDWIGASRGQVDELKETQAATLRINGSLSTYEAELARLGLDWRTVLAQQAREKKLFETLGLDYGPTAATRPGASTLKQTLDAPNNQDDDA